MDIKQIRQSIVDSPLFVRILKEDNHSIVAMMIAAKIGDRQRYCEMTVVNIGLVQTYTWFY